MSDLNEKIFSSVQIIGHNEQKDGLQKHILKA